MRVSERALHGSLGLRCVCWHGCSFPGATGRTRPVSPIHRATIPCLRNEVPGQPVNRRKGPPPGRSLSVLPVMTGAGPPPVGGAFAWDRLRGFLWPLMVAKRTGEKTPGQGP